MRFYLEKPIRVDYYPKTKEDIDEPERLEIEDSSDKELTCKITDEKESVEEETMECSSCTAKDTEEVTEKTVGEVTGDMEEVIEK